MKTVLFLGAGASTFAGMPTTKELVKGEGHDVLDRVILELSWDDNGPEQNTVNNLMKNLVIAHSSKIKENDVEHLYQKIRKLKEAEKLHKE